MAELNPTTATKKKRIEKSHWIDYSLQVAAKLDRGGLIWISRNELATSNCFNFHN